MSRYNSRACPRPRPTTTASPPSWPSCGKPAPRRPGRREAAARDHPDLADELRTLWATAQFAAFALPGSSSPTEPFVPAEPIPPPDSFGDYEILDELGRGGMGVVYKARQRSLNRIVALKMMREARVVVRGRPRSGSAAEAEAVARLQHPNIVTVYEVGDRDGLPFIVMEYVAGRTLAQRLADGPLPPREAARLVAQSPGPSSTPMSRGFCTGT